MSRSTAVITAEEYSKLERHGYAGTAARLEPETVDAFTRGWPDWAGVHWYMHWVVGKGTGLSPVNVGG
ncbi:MAG: hypothetical protein PHQ28_00850 [Mycobacterium sp.]|nr:hypothetical protein [Mycobacterium sp.]